MSREIRFEYYCDNKAAKHPSRTASADTIMVYSPKHQAVRELEVCDPCLDHLTHREVTDLVDRFGREIAEPEFDPELVCPLGCNHGHPFKNRAGRTRHMTTKHPDWEG